MLRRQHCSNKLANLRGTLLILTGEGSGGHTAHDALFRSINSEARANRDAVARAQAQCQVAEQRAAGLVQKLGSRDHQVDELQETIR